MTPDLVIRGSRVVIAGGVAPASLHVTRGRITAIDAFDSVPASVEVYEAGERLVMPGVVDSHVHVNEPGRTDWEGFETATASAAAGGVTTIVDMPLNSIPATTTAAALEVKRDAARGRIAVDVGFWGGIVPGNAADLDALCDAGVLGFKCFLVHSGVDEFPNVGEPQLIEALAVAARRGVPVLAHAELPGPIARAVEANDVTKASAADRSRHMTWLASRPPEAEVEAVDLLVRLARRLRARVHIVHVSAAEVLPLLAAARRDGLPVTAETCPHYLTFAAEQIPDGRTSFKCAPPIRGAANRDALWRAVLEGELDLIASDHSPCPPAMKCPGTGDFMGAWGGIASLELALPSVWTGLSARGGDVARLADLMCAAPARLAGLDNRKGRLAVGHDADVVVWDPDATRVVDPEALHHRHKVTPYAGLALRGLVHATFVRGRLVYDGVVTPGHGELLERVHP